LHVSGHVSRHVLDSSAQRFALDDYRDLWEDIAAFLVPLLLVDDQDFWLVPDLLANLVSSRDAEAQDSGRWRSAK
jgi:hypothetical protein